MLAIQYIKKQMKRPNWKVYKLAVLIELIFLFLCLIGLIIFSLYIFDNTFPVFKYSMLYINIISYAILITSIAGIIIVTKKWRRKITYNLSNNKKIIYSLSCLMLSFLFLSSIEYIIYINNQDKFNIENSYIKKSISDRILNVKGNIKSYKKYLDTYNHIYKELKNKKYIGYNSVDDFYFTIINEDTLEIDINKRSAIGVGIIGGIPITKLNNAETIGISLKNEPHNISNPSSKTILESMKRGDSINVNEFRLLIHQKIEMYQEIINEYKTISKDKLVVTFGDFVLYSIFNPDITGNKTHIFIRLIFLLQAIVITFFSGYIYQTLYKMLDGENTTKSEA